MGLYYPAAYFDQYTMRQLCVGITPLPVTLMDPRRFGIVLGCLLMLRNDTLIVFIGKCSHMGGADGHQ